MDDLIQGYKMPGSDYVSLYPFLCFLKSVELLNAMFLFFVCLSFYGLNPKNDATEPHLTSENVKHSYNLKKKPNCNVNCKVSYYFVHVSEVRRQLGQNS